MDCQGQHLQSIETSILHRRLRYSASKCSHTGETRKGAENNNSHKCLKEKYSPKILTCISNSILNQKPDDNSTITSKTSYTRTHARTHTPYVLVHRLGYITMMMFLT